jgi:hypothetical protein
MVQPMKTTRWPESPKTSEWSNRVRVPRAMLRLAWVEFLGLVPWDLFVTLTFDPKRVFPVNCTRAEREAFRWCGSIGYALRRPVGWLIALERGVSGQWHAHVLLVGVPHDISALATMWELRNGLINVQPVNNTIGVVLYSTKQAALSGEVVLSDTLAAYRDRLTDRPRVVLYPTIDEEDGVADGTRQYASEGIVGSRRLR